MAPYPADNDDTAVDQFIEKIFEEKREKAAPKSDDPATAYDNIEPEHDATPVDVKALEILLRSPSSFGRMPQNST